MSNKLKRKVKELEILKNKSTELSEILNSLSQNISISNNLHEETMKYFENHKYHCNNHWCFLIEARWAITIIAVAIIIALKV